MSPPPFQALLDAHGAAVHRFLVAYVGPADADDCFQEACIAALRAYPRLDRVENLRGWLLRIAQRKAIDAHRARARAPVPVGAAPSEPAGTGAPAAAEARDGSAPIWARVRELPEKQRTAVFLRSAAELSYAEVAAALDCSQEAARRSVHEGLKRLREEWGE
ncbi:MAG: RNA polymerase sigma factor [Thermoleophilaceae bacterium]